MRKILIITSLYPNIENSTQGIFINKKNEELKNRCQIKICSSVISKISLMETLCCFLKRDEF